MKHLLFLYLTVSYSISLISLTALCLAYLKRRSRVLKYICYFLLNGTIHLIFLTYIGYRCVNIPFWFKSYFLVIIFGLESFNIYLFPLLINELFKLNRRRQINYIFGILFLCGLACVLTPILLSVLNDGMRIEKLVGFKIYRFIFIGAYLYSFVVFGLRIKNINDRFERNILVSIMTVLLTISFQTIIPIITIFPENVFIFATGNFFINILLLKYAVNRFFKFSSPIFNETLDELVTSREKEVLLLLVEGLSNKDIGVKLCISEPTVKTHIQNIYKKFRVNNRIQLLNSLKNYFD